MKTVALALAFFLVNLISYAQDSQGVDITITIDNVSNDQGKVMASLHTENTFMKGPGVQNLESTITEGKVTLTFKNVTPGTYAIMALHDANDNKRMDFENGMPKESYGMSGNDMSFGPPTFEGSKFDVTSENMDLQIRF